MKRYIAEVVAGRDLTPEAAADAVAQIMDGSATPAQIAALLVGLRVKGETIEEIASFAQGMRARSIRVHATRQPLLDTCGTGGDSLKTFNISTTAAFVAAGAGAAVAKHGNRAVTSASGSADVLEALGVQIDPGADEVGACIDEVGIGFLFARSHHPAMKYVAPVRSELGVRTLFNALGPLTNPAGATRQLIGVYDPALCEPLARVLVRLGSEHVLVVHADSGLDEIATFGTTVVAEGRTGDVVVRRVTASDFEVEEGVPEAVAPGASVQENAELLRGVLDGQPGPRREIVVANAAAALYVVGLADTFAAGASLARAAIDSGAARAKLDALAARSRQEER